MYELYEKYSPTKETTKLLKVVSRVIDNYRSMHLRLTLRQLYYQLVAMDLIPNTERQYKRIGKLVSRARRGGLLDWSALEDRVRVPRVPAEFESIAELVEYALRWYRRPRMRGQHYYIELWVEKDALAGVLTPIADAYHITLMVNRGYSSTSAMKEAGERIRRSCNEIGTQFAVILYLGDLDPSGEDMVRDVAARLEDYTNSGIRYHKKGSTFSAELEEDCKERLSPKISINVEKLALTPAQVKKHDPPPNPAKMTDSRAKGYVEKHGDKSWEVDALPPPVLRDIIVRRLDELIDDSLVEAVRDRERGDKERLRELVEGL